MITSRRTLLKQLAVITAGVALAPSLVGCTPEPSLLFKNLAVTKDQEDLMSTLVRLLIPKTGTPGAEELGVKDFCAKMIDDCLTKGDQEKLARGLADFAKGFPQNGEAEQLAFLTTLDESEEDKDVNYFFNTMKHLTIRGYTSSEYFLTNVQGYKMIPGAFKGCVPVNNPA